MQPRCLALFSIVELIGLAVAQAPALISPPGARTGLSPSLLYEPFVAGPIHYQQIHHRDAIWPQVPTLLTQMRFRTKGPAVGPTLAIDVELHVGTATVDPQSATTVFANNATSEANVFARALVKLPSVSSSGWLGGPFVFNAPYFWSSRACRGGPSSGADRPLSTASTSGRTESTSCTMARVAARLPRACREATSERPPRSCSTPCARTARTRTC